MLRALASVVCLSNVLCCSGSPAAAGADAYAGDDADCASDAGTAVDANHDETRWRSLEGEASAAQVRLENTPRPTPTVWPERFLNTRTTDFFLDNAQMEAVRQGIDFSFHRSAENAAAGVVVIRGLNMSGTPFERWLQVQMELTGYPNVGHLWVTAETSRERFTGDSGHVADREANYDAVAAVHSLCVTACPDEEPRRQWCFDRCAHASQSRLSIEDVVFARSGLRVILTPRGPSSIDATMPSRSMLTLRWSGAESRLYDVSPVDGPEFDVVTLSSQRRALSIHTHQHPGRRYIYVHDDGENHELQGRIVHDYRHDVAQEGTAGSRSLPWVDYETRDALVFPGDNTIRRRVHETEYCRESERDGNESSWEWRRSRRSEVVLRLDRTSMRIVSASKRTGRWQPCVEEHIAACPFVDILGPNGATRIGEILRNVRYESETQSLALPAAQDDVLTLRISEEKPERTLLDAFHLNVDGVAVRPRACECSPQPAYCAEDGVHHVLNEGDVLDADFDLPPGHQTLSLVATGHYLPLSELRETSAEEGMSEIGRRPTTQRSGSPTRRCIQPHWVAP